MKDFTEEPKINWDDLSTKKAERNKQGYPLLPDGNIDWDLVSSEKDAYIDMVEHTRDDGSYRKIRKTPNTHLTPKKKKRK